MKALHLTFVFTALITYAVAQSSNKRNSFLAVGFMQVNEDANMGLVFKGPEIDYGMIWFIENEKRLITCEYKIGVGVLSSKEMLAIGFYLKPAEVAYLFKLPVLNNKLFFGPAIGFEYRYNLYPDLQSGFDYWFTNFSLGVHSRYHFDYKNSFFRIVLKSSMAGFTSRQPDYRNPHFYDLGFSHAIDHLNQDLTGTALNEYNVTNLELWWRPDSDSRLTLGYGLEYSGYYVTPALTMVNHSIKLVFNRK